MKYALIIYENPEQMAQRQSHEAPAYWAAWMAYSEAVKAAEIQAGGTALQPPATATTVKFRADKKHVQDGPFADTKELLGGFFIIDVPDLDKALEWASRAPLSPGGSVEVRPLLVMPPAK
jgi:hypothetical protein